MGTGFLAQLIDALGMVYGVSCSGLLLTFGLSPAVASASVHTAKVFSTGVSGLSHLIVQNINKTLFFRIMIPGVFRGSNWGLFDIRGAGWDLLLPPT